MDRIIIADVRVPFKSCFKFREMNTDLSDRNWLEESHLYMQDWLRELKPSSRAWISNSSSANSEEIERDVWSSEFDSCNEDWETESETELNVHVRDWIAEFGDWETPSDTRVSVPTLHGFEDNNGRDTGETKCMICFDEFDRLIKFGAMKSCRHKFCFQCIEKWSEVVRTCPMDRIPFSCIIERSCGLIVNILDLPPLP